MDSQRRYARLRLENGLQLRFAATCPQAHHRLGHCHNYRDTISAAGLIPNSIGSLAGDAADSAQAVRAMLENALAAVGPLVAPGLVEAQVANQRKRA